MTSPPPSSVNRQSWLARLAGVGLQRPKTTVGVALLVLAICGLALWGMPISTSRYKLVAADNPYQAKMLRFFDRYGYPDSLVVVVGGPDAAARRAAVDTLSAKLEAMPELQGRVLGRMHARHIAELLLLFEPRALDQLAERLDGSPKALLEAGLPAWIEAVDEQLQAGLEGEGGDAGDAKVDTGLAQVTKLVRALDDHLEGGDATAALIGLGDDKAAKLPTSITLDDAGYLTTTNGEYHLIALFPSLPGMEGQQVAPLVEAIRKTRDEAGLPANIEAKVTGLPAFVADEVSVVSRGLFETSAATTVGIILLLLFAFRSFRYTFLSLMPLGVGVVLTLAMTRLIFGGLNLITSSFVSVLLALGIDFGVYVLARYGELVRGGKDTADAIAGALEKAGPGMILGAVTTIFAFLMTTVIEFTAYSELGIITAMGLVFMVAVTFLLLPALIFLAGKGERIESPELGGVRTLPSILYKIRWIAPSIALVGVLVAVPGWFRIQFNARYFDFLPDNTETSWGLDRIEDDPNLSPVQASVGVDGVEAARALADRLRALDEVGTVQSGTDLLPKLSDEDLAALRKGLAAGIPDFAKLRDRKRDPQELKDAVNGLVDTVDEVAFALRRADRPTAAVDELKKALTKLKKDVDGLSDDEPLARTERDAADLLERAFATAKQVADRGGYEPTDLPPLFRTRFTSKDGKGLAIFANPKGDIWNAATAETFARKVQEVAPEMSGLAVTVHEHMRMIKEGFAKASLLSVGMVLIVLFIGFRRIEDVLFAVLPVAIGVSWLLGIMGYFGLNFDVANIVAVPLVMGVGVDAGTHMIHRWRQSADRAKGKGSLEEIIRGTGAAVLMASLTTATGFAALMLGEYGGMKTLGLTMTLGVLGCLIASLVVLPCVLVLTGRAR